MAHLEICGGYASSNVVVAAIFVGPGTPKAAVSIGLTEVQAHQRLLNTPQNRTESTMREH
jgi:hypothetical protein